MSISVKFVVIGSLVWSLAACGGAPLAVDPTAPTGPVTKSVTAAGATIRVVGEDGGALELTFPPDGVFEDVEVTVAPVAAAVGGRARFEFEPSDLALRRPVEMGYTAPPGIELDAQSTFTLGPVEHVVLLPSVRGGVASLRTRTYVLGPSVEAVGASNAHGGAGIALNVADVQCQLATASLLERLERARNFPFSSAESGTRLVQQIESTELLCDGDAEYFDVVRPMLQEASCDGYRDASADAAVAVVDSAASFKAVAGPLMNWEGSKQATGTDCGRADDEILDDLEPKFREFIDAYKDKIARGALPDTYEELWQEVRGVLRVDWHSAALGLPDVTESVEHELLTKMWDLLREAAYAHCRSDDDQAYLVDLLMGGGLYKRPLTPLEVAPRAIAPAVLPSHPQWASYTIDALLDDIQYCASRVVLEVLTPLARSLGDLTRTLEGGATPSTHVTSASTRAPATGSLVLDGAIAAFLCREPVRSSNDELVVRFNGVEVDRIARSDRMLLGSPRTLDVAAMLATAGLDPTQKRTYPLVLERAGESCATLYGYSPTKLFTFDVEIDPAPTLSGVTASTSSVQAEFGTEVTFALAFDDEGRNLESTRATYALPNKAASTAMALADSDRAAGFGEERGTGTLRVDVRVYCSEYGQNPLRVEFVLIDAFDQESESRSVDLTVSYEPCDA